MIKTTQDARNKFKQSGLTYKDLTESNRDLLNNFIIEHLLIHDKKKVNITKMMLLKKTIRKFNILKRQYTGYYLFVSGDNFEEREAISFNENGFIGFAGWASSNNVEPFIQAFDDWMNAILDIKNKQLKED